jgi:beta-lactamase class A
MAVHRRRFVRLLGLIAGSSIGISKPRAATADNGDATAPGPLDGLLDAFLALPGNKGVAIAVDDPRRPWRIGHGADVALFCGSCFKTFVLVTYLQEVEAGRLSEAEQLPIDDRMRSVGGGVFDHLSGTASARTILEAMIAHSDNTATDAAMRRVGVDKIRAFLANANLKGARVPDSTRRFFSYLAGYPADADMGWAGIKDFVAGKNRRSPREAINDEQTMVCPAAEFVDYYKRALAGQFFAKPETLVEFKRILAMADAVTIAIPADTPAYLKGGSIDWEGFHCIAIAGQMIVGRTPVTFCLTLNWRDSEASEAAQVPAYKSAVAGLLARIKQHVLTAPA